MPIPIFAVYREASVYDRVPRLAAHGGPSPLRCRSTEAAFAPARSFPPWKREGVARVPSLAESRGAQIPVRADLAPYSKSILTTFQEVSARP